MDVQELVLIWNRWEELMLLLATSQLSDAGIGCQATDGILNLVRPWVPPAIISETNGGNRPFVCLRWL